MNTIQHRSILPMAGLVASLAAGLALPAAAQNTKVIPSTNANVEGSTLSVYPFGYTNPIVQQIFRNTAVTTSIALVTGIKYRRDTGQTAAMTGRTYTNATISLGTTSVAPEKMSTTFSNNVTTALTHVLNAGTLVLPSLPSPTTSPAAFNIGLNWTTPFIYDSKKGHLLMQTYLPGTVGKSSYFIDADYVSAAGQGSVNSFGTGGAFASPETYQLAADANTLLPGGSLAMTCGKFTKAYTGTLVFGLSNASWAGVNLPLDLAVIGAPKNNLYVSMDLQFPFAAQGSASSYQSAFKASVPNSSTYAGVSFYSQAWYVDAKANKLGIVATEALALTTGIVGGPIMQTVGYYDAKGTTGNLWASGKYGGPIVQFAGVIP